jgi:hypothetical protein
MSLLERALIAVAAVLVVAALVLLMKSDIGRNADIPAGGIVDQPAGRQAPLGAIRAGFSYGPW